MNVTCVFFVVVITEKINRLLFGSLDGMLKSRGRNVGALFLSSIDFSDHLLSDQRLATSGQSVTS